MKNRKNTSLAVHIATAVLSVTMAAKRVMPEPDQMIMLSMMMGAPLLIGLTGSLKNWHTDVGQRLYGANPGSSDNVRSLP